MNMAFCRVHSHFLSFHFQVVYFDVNLKSPCIVVPEYGAYNAFQACIFDENKTALRVLGMLYQNKAAIRFLDILD